MNKILKYSISIWLLSSLTLGAMASGEKANFESRFLIQFSIGSSQVKPQYKDNYYAIAELDRFFATIDFSNVDSISIVGSSSPDGSETLNKQLARERALSMSGLITDKFRIDPCKIYLRVKGDSWPEMLSLIRRDDDFPNKAHTLIVLENDVPYKQRLHTMQFLQYREAMSYLKREIYPRLRNAMAIVVYYKAEEKFEVHDNKVDYINNEAFITPLNQAPSLMDIAPKPLERADSSASATTPVAIFQPENFVPKKPVLAIKTNLLFDAVSALNLELEVPIGNRWSVLAEVVAPWWLFSKDQVCLQVFSANVEGRYWFCDREEQSRLKGWFMGVYAGGMYYDLEWRGRGFQGESLISMGLTAGFAHSISKHLRMEYSLGVGYINTKYREYQWGADQNGVYGLDLVGRGQKSWIGPTKVKVSLVWMINRRIR